MKYLISWTGLAGEDVAPEGLPFAQGFDTAEQAELSAKALQADVSTATYHIVAQKERWVDFIPCMICGEPTGGPPACLGCWDEAAQQGLL